MRPAAKTPFEVETGGLDEFLRLLEMRAKETGAITETLPRRAVCVADMFDHNSTEIGIPRVKRYVRAPFVYGDDLVSLQLVSSHGYERPDPEQVKKLDEKQSRLLHDVRESITVRIDDLGLSAEFPIIKAFIHPSRDPRVCSS